MVKNELISYLFISILYSSSLHYEGAHMVGISMAAYQNTLSIMLCEVLGIYWWHSRVLLHIGAYTVCICNGNDTIAVAQSVLIGQCNTQCTSLATFIKKTPCNWEVIDFKYMCVSNKVEHPNDCNRKWKFVHLLESSKKIHHVRYKTAIIVGD